MGDRGRLLGLIYVGNDSVIDLFQEQMMRALTVFSSQASLLIRNALLVNELRLDNKQLGEELERMRYGSIIGSAPLMQVSSVSTGLSASSSAARRSP